MSITLSATYDRQPVEGVEGLRLCRRVVGSCMLLDAYQAYTQGLVIKQQRMMHEALLHDAHVMQSYVHQLNCKD